MSAIAWESDRGPVGTWRFGRKVADRTVGLIVFLGAFVLFEPAPYELLLGPVVIVWAFFGLRINRHFLPMTTLMLLYVAGGVLSLTQTPDIGRGAIYIATTGFLVVSSIFFAAVITEAPERRLIVIRRAYIAAAVIATVIGIAGYFRLLPGSDSLLLYGRLKATFQDPNVFGPFLVLPIVLLFQDILTHRLSRAFGKELLLLILVVGVFLTFSRAAWGMTLFAFVFVAILAFINASRQIARFRIVAYLLGGLAVVALIVTIALLIPAVSDLFAQRAQLVESYDAGRLGRFDRQILGFFLVQESPFGVGPFEFGQLFSGDEHNMWLKGFTVYGWLGGFAYIVLVMWTMVAAAPLLFKPRPWQPMVTCTYAVFLGHLMIHNVIDNDHWRHMFLIYGILWGAIAAEKMLRREQVRLAGGTGPLISHQPQPS